MVGGGSEGPCFLLEQVVEFESLLDTDVDVDVEEEEKEEEEVVEESSALVYSSGDVAKIRCLSTWRMIGV